MTGPARPPRGKKGYRVTATRKHDPEKGTGPLDHHDSNQEDIIPPPGVLPEHPAYVGCSVGTAMKTKWARESVDVAAWCTLPCDITPEARADAFEEAKHMCVEEVGRIMTATLDTYFPDFGEHDDERDG
jgi:hypothetical protein